MRLNSIILICVLSTYVFSIILSKNVYAYLDPGTGSYFFQMIIASVIGGLFALKIFWMKIKVFIKNLFPNEK